MDLFAWLWLLHPGEGRLDRDRLGSDLFAQYAFKDRSIDLFNLHHGMGRKEHMCSALVAKDPTAAELVGDRRGASGSPRGFLPESERHVRPVDRRRRQLRGQGPAFSAGHDLAEMVGKSKQFYEHEFAVCARLMETIVSIPQPVIAEVHGVATAAGCQLVATCDLAVASDEARFATPGVKIGLFCSTPMVSVSRKVGRKRAMEMLLTGDFISAEEAVSAGLVNRVVPSAELSIVTRALAEKIATSSPLVVGIGKQAFYRQIDMPLHEAYQYTSDVMVSNAGLADAQEGMRAFLEKRAPEWRGK